MPSFLHEGLLDLFRNRPTLAPDLLRDQLHAPLPRFDRVRVADANLTELLPTELRADLVLLLEREAAGAANAALVVEVQLGADPGKRWSWPAYVTSLRARLRCDVTLLVVTSNAPVAAWASKPIATGHPGFALTPLVLGPNTVPLVRSEEEAARSPELAVLSVLIHRDEPHALDVAKAALVGACGLDADRAALYTDLVLALVNDAARAVLEDLMASGHYQYQSNFAKRYVEQGRQEGMAEGREQGVEQGRADALRDAIARVLSARSLALTDAARARLDACTDVATLTAWLERAAIASSEADVFPASPLR
jgi:hypothetical protein